MSTFKKVINKVTNQVQTQFEAKLISIADAPKEMQNAKQTLYRNCTIQFADKDAVEQTVSALMYESNYAYGVEVGKSYLATATKTDRGVLISVSHLVATTRPTEDMFGFDESTEYEEAEAVMQEAEAEMI